jgi:hypothetical protein
MGEPVDELSGLLQISRQPGRVPVGPVILVVLGVVFLLNTLGKLRLAEILRFWPVVLIVAGLYLLFARMSAGRSDSSGVDTEAK